MEDFLDQLLSANKGARDSATKGLDDSITQPGFAIGLITVAKRQSEPLARRQMCLTIVKDLIRKRWHELPESERVTVLDSILPLSLDSSSSVRSLSHACIALGASRAGISQWKGLLQSISEGLLSSSVTLDLKKAIITLLINIIDECGGSAMLPVADDVLGMLLEASSLHPGLERRCVEAWAALLFNIAQDEELDYLNNLKGKEKWKQLLLSLMSSPDTGNCIGGLKSVTHLLSSGHFESFLAPSVVDLLPACILLLERNQKSYESLVLFSEEGGIDESDEGGLSTLVLAVCEFVNATVISDQLCTIWIRDDLLSKFFPAIAPYIQIPLSVEEEWLQSPVEFIAQEQDDLASSTSIRIVFEGIVADVFTNPLLCETGLVVLHALSLRMIGEGIKAEQSGNSEGWRSVEAGLFALGLTSHEFSIRSVDQSIQDILKLAAQLVANNDTSRPLLKARALLTLSRFAEIASKHFNADLSMIVRCSVQALNGDSVVVVYSACRALNGFLSFVEKNTNNTEMVTKGGRRLVQLATSASEHEVVHFALESLIGIACHFPEVSTGLCLDDVKFLPSMLNRYVNDPIVPAQVVEIMQNAPPPSQVYEQLAEVIKPWIREDAEIELDVALDILHEIVQHAPTPFSGHVLECILILNYNSSIADIGEETGNIFGSILRICAIRQAD